ncbi:MAG: hypothetical protein KC729_01130 [Candidatus Eisenbacteria bacterium]|uniref:FlgD/Vpr Ig-like domain-containing protein n=1 Tax=Eiseniibacteriota bacterium TaxID=2212470 RepID=A0A956LVT7_UNCEI|nr:hypothetical protein [Candidatus Eisenbacteria bacterium]
MGHRPFRVLPPRRAKQLVRVVAFLCVLAVAALVGRRTPSPGPPDSGAFDRVAFERAAHARADGLFRPEWSWSVVADLGTPSGSYLRIRPQVGPIEVFGCDLVVRAARADEEDSRDPVGSRAGTNPTLHGGASADDGIPQWFLSSAPGAEEIPAPTGSSGVEGPLAWRCRSVPTFEDRAALLTLSASTTGAAQRLSSAGLQAVRWQARRGRDGWELWATGTIDPASSALGSAFSTEAGGSMPVRVRIDTETGAWTEVRDDRLLAEETGEALIFDPNPVVISGRTNLRDGDDVDGYRSRVSLPRLDGSGRLRGTWIETRSDRPPLANEPSLVFDFPSYDPRFEEAMAYYHCDRGIATAEERGFTGLFRTRIYPRVHGTAADNSWYSRPTREIVFGDGGVDDAEDGDIILHELGHAIHDAIVPGFGDGDTRAISEGFSDFWAASLTDDPCVGNWDATSYSPPCLRSTDQNAVYPGSLTGRPHTDGQIWSGLLWDLHESLGTEAAERLALAAFLEQDPDSRWPEAADALLRAAEASSDPTDRTQVLDALVRRGLVARELTAELATNETWTLRFLSPGTFMGQPATGLVLAGDGTVRFGEPSTPLRFPESAPVLAAAGLGEAENAPLGLVLACTVRLDAGLVTIHQTWRVRTMELVTVRIEWNTVSGALSWTYEQAVDGAGGLDLFAGAATVGDAVTDIDWNELPGDGIDALVACRGPVTSPASLVGARFSLFAESPPVFRVARTGPPRPAGEAPLLTAFPNPSRGNTLVRLFLDRDASVEVSLFDARGRRVRELASSAPRRAGLSEWTWDGRDERGHVVPAGRYWARARVEGRTARLPLLLVR